MGRVWFSRVFGVFFSFFARQCYGDIGDALGGIWKCLAGGPHNAWVLLPQSPLAFLGGALGISGQTGHRALVPGWLASSMTSGTAGLGSTTGLKSTDGHPSIHAERGNGRDTPGHFWGAAGAVAESPCPLAGGDWQKHTGLDMTLQRASRDSTTAALPDVRPSF